MGPSNDRMSESPLADITESLMAQYEPDLPLQQVSAVVIGAHRELDRQVPTAALPELLHRLARARLDQLSRLSRLQAS